ncbi:MAG: hypothetical protein H6584_09065, partial [Flavobacteriales bacterium]|nr:hypothetical protein [Flavobacteriales bacterium]
STEFSFGIGLGYDIYLSEEDYVNSLSINLYYNGIELGKSLNALKHYSGGILKTSTLGIGLVYYFDVKKKSQE